MHKRSIDYLLLGSIIILSIFGLLMVYSASNVVAEEKYLDSFYYLKRQGIFFVIGMVLLYFIINFNIIKIKKYVNILFIICLILLIIVLIPGIGMVRGGARSWIGIGNFSIQPSEFMKLGLILLLAKYLSEHYEEAKEIKTFIFLLLFILGIFLLILLQPDFGTGLVLLLSCIVLLFIGGAKLKYFIVLALLGIVGIVILILSAPYRMERITAYLNPWNDPLGSGFQGIQSLFAITPGGLFGHGYNQSIQKHFFLPEPQNDFIFAIIVEEFGLLGGLIVLSFYFFIIYRGMKIGFSVDDYFLQFVAIGISISLAVQVFINVGVVIGLLPVTGITLPLFSYGGSSLLLTILSLGILVSISKYQNYDTR